MFSLAEKIFCNYYRDASETDFLLLIFILNHLREQIVDGEKFCDINKIAPNDRSKEQLLFCDIWDLPEFKIINEICNGAKHHKIENNVMQLKGLRCGIGRCGDRFDQKYILIDGTDSRIIFSAVIIQYRNYFNKKR